MLSNGRPPRNHDEQMIFNNFLTMRMIGECKAEKLTKDRIFEIHRRVTLETLTNPDAAGRFRNADDGDIYVHDKMSLDIYHRPPAPDTLDHRLQLLCDFANGSTAQGFVHPVIRAIIVHFMLAYDHPFVDGNGRTARALFYWTLLHHGYWLFEFITISPILRKSPGRYAKAFLYTETDENDLTYFILHQLDVIDKAMAAFRAYVARKTQQQHAIEQKLRGHVSLNHRQIALLSHAGRHPMHRYTVTSHQTRHGTVYQTARTDLLELEKQGLLVKTKLGKTFYFAAVENLEKALEQLGGAND
jgi:Fic family protein